jgi:hypothetical protein
MARNFHERIETDERIEGPTDRAFGLTVGGILVALALVKAFLFTGWTGLAWALLSIGAALVALGLLRPPLLAPLNRAWLRLGLFLFKIVNPIVMFLIYATTVVPIGLWLRLRGKDLLRLRRDPAAPSYWIPREPPGPAPESMRNQF